MQNLSIIIGLYFFIFRVAVRERNRQYERKLDVWSERLVSVRQRLSKLKDMVISKYYCINFDNIDEL